MVPALPGREGYAGEVMHVCDYRGPQPFRGRRMLVVVAGNNSKDVATAAVGVASSVTIGVRDGAVFVPYPNAVSQRSGELWRRLPPRLVDAALRRLRRAYPELGLPSPQRAPREVVAVVGLELVDAVRAGPVPVRPAAVLSPRTACASPTGLRPSTPSS